jgi:hypothetical protein
MAASECDEREKEKGYLRQIVLREGLVRGGTDGGKGSEGEDIDPNVQRWQAESAKKGKTEIAENGVTERVVRSGGWENAARGERKPVRKRAPYRRDGERWGERGQRRAMGRTRPEAGDQPVGQTEKLHWERKESGCSC